MLRRGPWRTYSQGASRRTKPKYLHWSNRVHFISRIFNLIANLITKYHWKPTSKVTVVTLLMYIYVRLLASILFPLFSCVRYVIQEQVFIFRRLKINHESDEFMLDPGTVANNNLFRKLSENYTSWITNSLGCRKFWTVSAGKPKMNFCS
jgi:hypothetical protein